MQRRPQRQRSIVTAKNIESVLAGIAGFGAASYLMLDSAYPELQKIVSEYGSLADYLLPAAFNFANLVASTGAAGGSYYLGSKQVFSNTAKKAASLAQNGIKGIDSLVCSAYNLLKRRPHNAEIGRLAKTGLILGEIAAYALAGYLLYGQLQRIPEAFAISPNTSAPVAAVSKTSPTSNNRTADPGPHAVDPGPLANVNFGNGFGYILGVTGTITEPVNVDFRKQLGEVWDSKIRVYSGNGEELRAFRKANVDPYVNGKVKPTISSVDDYIRRADNAVKEVNNNLDWNAVGKYNYLDARRLELVKKMSKTINGRHLTAYAMTEMMPSSDGELNKKALSFILRNAGMEYLQLYPSLADGYLSKGMFQFTEEALHDDGRKNPETLPGASVINRALPPGKRVARNVAELEGDDEIKAAYLFSIYNLALLSKSLNATQLSELEKFVDGINQSSTALLQYIGAAHNRPGNGLSAASYWLANQAKYPFSVSCPNDICRMYAQKTEANFQALR